MPGATCAGEVGEHGVAHRGGDAEPVAEGVDGPLDDVLGRRELELGADVGDQLAQLLAAATVGVGAAELAGRLVVAAVMTAPGLARDAVESGPSDLADEGDRERPQARAALPGAVRRRRAGSRSSLAAVGAVERDWRARLMPASAAFSSQEASSARTTQVANDSPSSRSSR